MNGRWSGLLGLAGGAIGVLAGLTEVVAGAGIPAWSGDKADPLALGLLTVALGLAAMMAGWTTVPARSVTAGRSVAVAVVLLVVGALGFSTCGRLWYLPGAAILLAAAGTVAAVGVRVSIAVLQEHWMRGLLSALGAVELLMAASARPVALLVVGAVGGLVLLGVPWTATRARRVRVGALLLGTLPFALLTWWTLVTPLLAVTALVIGACVLGRARAGGSGQVAAAGR
jgi:uncharacterized membrane protein YqgA involved in biofilm formation